MEFVVGSPREVVVRWSPPLEPNGIITVYTVNCFVLPDLGGGGGGGGGGSGSGAGGGGPPFDFQGAVDLFGITEFSTVVVAGSQLTASVTDLIPFTVYVCAVMGNTSIGEGPFSRPDITRTDESSE